MNRFVRLAFTIALLLSFVAPLGPGASAQGDESSAARLDLAAMVLNPGDLESVGLEGFGLHRLGYPRNGANAGRHILFRGRASEEPLDQGLLAAGLLREYTAILGLPDADLSALEQQVEMHLTEYLDEDGAEAGFALLTDVGFTEESESTAEPLESSATFGDESVMFSYHIVVDASEYDMVALTILVGHLTARIAFADFTGEEPDSDLLEELGELFVERIEAGLDGDLPGGGLSLQVPRFFHVPGDDTDLENDGYLRIDGETMRSAGDDDAAFEARDERYRDAVDVFTHVRRYRVDYGTIDYNNVLRIELARFESDDDAESWMADAIEVFEESGDFEDVDESASAYGDESVTYTYTFTGSSADDIWNGERVFMRVGDTVAVMYVQRFDRPLTPVLEPLATTQVSCIENGVCDNPVLLPPAAHYDNTECPDEPADASGADDGDLLWCFEAGSGFAEPVLANDRLYAWSLDGFLYALDPETGALRWRASPGPMAASSGFAPLIVDDLVIVTLRTLGAMIAYDAETGTERWRAAPLLDDPDTQLSPPWLQDDELAVVAGADLLRLDPETGEVLDRIELDLDGATIHDVADGIIFAKHYRSDEEATFVIAYDAETGDGLWETELPGWSPSNLVAADGSAYILSDVNLLVIDTESGDITDEHEIDIEAVTSARLNVIDETLYLQYSEAPVAEFLAVDLDSGEVIWRYELWPNHVDVTQSGDRVYLSGWADVSDERAVALDAESGNIVWDSNTGFYGAEAIVVGDGIVYGANGGGTLYAFADSEAESEAAPADAGDDEAEDDPSQDTGSGGDTEIYESPHYGYTITYDPNEWTFSEDAAPDDDYDWAIFISRGGFVAVVGDPDYDDDELETCVDDYRTALEASDQVSRVRELRNEGGEEDGRVWAVFSYEWEDDDGETADYIRSISCQALDDGLTLVVMHDAPEESFDDLMDASEALLATFEEA